MFRLKNKKRVIDLSSIEQLLKPCSFPTKQFQDEGEIHGYTILLIIK